jgi:Urb2/Npa2 family
MRRDERSWLLFLYLVYHIPCQALARILIEADFVTNVSTCFCDGERALDLSSATRDGAESAMSLPEPKPKKRKRDKSDQSKVEEHGQQPSPDSIPALFAASICAAIKRCVDLSTSDADQVSSEHIKLALAALARIAASVTGRLISDIVKILSHGPPVSFNGSALAECVPGLFGLWEYRIADEAGISGGSDQEFTNHCLSSCLALLLVLKTNELTTMYGQIVKQVERLIALHSILPARAEFTSTLNSPAGSRAKDGVATSPILGVLSCISDRLSPLLYDIAVRTIPRNTVRRRQSEQPWLEALFAKLVTSSGDDGLHELLRVALTHKIVLSQTELSQIAIRQFSNAKIRWSLIEQILQIDASAFFSNSAPLMARLCDGIAASGGDDYALIRDSIVIPLTRVAAQTRELHNYVQMWHRRLSEDIQEDINNLGRRGSRVWQDPELFAAFSEIARTNSTPFFVHKIIRRSLEQMATSNTEEDAIFEGLAWTAILGSIITARAQDCLADVGALRQLLACIAVLITHPQCPPSQRWRLWRLVRQILTIMPYEDADDILPFNNGELAISTSLENWSKMDATSELIEGFHLLVYQATVRPAKYELVLREEFKHLAEVLDAVSHPSNHLSPFRLTDACLGIILQNPEILLLTPADELWPALWRYASSSRSTTGQHLFTALVSSDTVTSNQILLSKCFQVIYDSVARHDRHRSEFAYKTLLSMPCQNIKRSQERTKLIKMLEDAGIGNCTEDMIQGPSSKSEDNPLFHEFKARASSSSTITHAEGRLPVLQANSFERFCLEVDYAKLTLTTPNQYLVDDLLSTLTLLTSPKSPKFENMPYNGPSAIYQRLCSLTSVLLTRFRKRLGGRYHLLLPVLQGLLRCLFQPIPIPTSSKQPQIRHHHPPWLLNPDMEPLTAKSATRYTRLLTSLCDPTASSVKHSRRTSAALTDDTKKARSIAGQYMQYLIMEYARCQLQGQLPPEVKAALMPGLYVVLDVMSRDLMGGMNAAMDSSSRAIFKGLYEDYQRFGRWNQN